MGLQMPTPAAGGSSGANPPSWPVYNSYHPPQPSAADPAAYNPNITPLGGYPTSSTAPGSHAARLAAATSNPHHPIQPQPSFHQPSSTNTSFPHFQGPSTDAQVPRVFPFHQQPPQASSGQYPYQLPTPNAAATPLQYPAVGTQSTGFCGGAGEEPRHGMSPAPVFAHQPAHNSSLPQGTSTTPCMPEGMPHVPVGSCTAPQHSHATLAANVGSSVQSFGAHAPHVSHTAQQPTPRDPYQNTHAVGAVSEEPGQQFGVQRPQGQAQLPFHAAPVGKTMPPNVQVQADDAPAQPTAPSSRTNANFAPEKPTVAKLPLSQVQSGNPGVPIANTHIARWVYPTNKPVREYQLSITESGLFDNTLVCLPTGLGKTLIAAVIMCNFYRCSTTSLFSMHVSFSCVSSCLDCHPCLRMIAKCRRVIPDLFGVLVAFVGPLQVLLQYSTHSVLFWERIS